MYLIGTAAWVWLVIVGIWMLTPNGPVCLACGPQVNLCIAIFSVILGIGGLASRYMTSVKPAN